MLYLPTSSYFNYSTSLIFMQDRRYNKTLTQQQHKCLGSQPERKAWPFGWAFFFLLCVLFTLPLDSACPSPCGLWSSGP